MRGEGITRELPKEVIKGRKAVYDDYLTLTGLNEKARFFTPI